MYWAYLLSFIAGSFPTAYLYALYFHKIDIRQHGSGNMGATNSLRILGKKAGLIVFVLDLLKGLIPVFITSLYTTDQKVILITGILAVLGHIFSPWVKFKGGKGIATTFGVILVFSPIAALLAITVFFVCIHYSRYVSLGSLLGVATFTLFIWFSFKDQPPVPMLCLGLCFLLFMTHRNNIKRLINGVENKI